VDCAISVRAAEETGTVFQRASARRLADAVLKALQEPGAAVDAVLYALADSL
jgi:hypothetical protein